MNKRKHMVIKKRRVHTQILHHAVKYKQTLHLVHCQTQTVCSLGPPGIILARRICQCFYSVHVVLIKSLLHYFGTVAQMTHLLLSSCHVHVITDYKKKKTPFLLHFTKLNHVTGKLGNTYVIVKLQNVCKIWHEYKKA